MQNSKKDNENSFYAKYFFYIWMIFGYFGTLIIALSRGASFEKNTDYLFFLVLLIASPILAIFWYFLFIMTSFCVSLFWDGINEKDPASIFAAFWLGIGLVIFILDTLFASI
ncbi:MAG: hypothetical protein RBR35_17495 [Salinivirgaceae bacterium]|nr:hypothetical protein [Salinivirgaceae bacterium]